MVTDGRTALRLFAAFSGEVVVNLQPTVELLSNLLGLVVFGALGVGVAATGFWLLQRYF